MACLRMMKVDDGGETHWVVAASEADVRAVITEHFGDEPDEILRFVHLDPLSEFSVVSEDMPFGKWPERAKCNVTATVHQWIQHQGRGLVASTVYP